MRDIDITIATIIFWYIQPMTKQWVYNRITAPTYILRDLIKSNDSLCFSPPHYTNSNKNDMNYCK